MTCPKINVDPSFICPLTLEIMNQPLMSKHGFNFERSAILEWLSRGNKNCPLTRKPLEISKLVPNHALQGRILAWKQEHGEDVSTTETETSTASSVEDITYFIPTSSAEVLQKHMQHLQGEQHAPQTGEGAETTRARRRFWGGRLRQALRGN